MEELRLDDMQGLMAYAYRRRQQARYVLLKVKDGKQEQARAWLRAVRPRVRSARRMARLEHRSSGPDIPPPLTIAFSHSGLVALGLCGSALDSFVPEFRQGMTHPHRSRVLGDKQTHDWEWGGLPKLDEGTDYDKKIHHANLPDILVAAYAENADALGRWVDTEITSKTDTFVVIADVVAELPTFVDSTGKVTEGFMEPFGFRDGISQPEVEGFQKGPKSGVIDNIVKAGEFVLGYPNEHNRSPASPWIKEEEYIDNLQAPDEEREAPLLPPVGPSHRDFGRNGTFLVVRHLAQDVAGFRAELNTEEKAAKFMGRWRSGAPLVMTSHEDAPRLGKANDFGYYTFDRSGLSCPLGAHIRRANPRDALANPELNISPEEATLRANQHRILRRGRGFKACDHKHACTCDDQGLFFICLNTNIERQFEFLQQAWLMNPGFGGLTKERDLTAGSYKDEPDAHGRTGKEKQLVHTVPECGKPSRQDISQYVSVKGGGYFFMPGLRALRYLARE